MDTWLVSVFPVWSMASCGPGSRCSATRDVLAVNSVAACLGLPEAGVCGAGTNREDAHPPRSQLQRRTFPLLWQSLMAGAQF